MVTEDDLPRMSLTREEWECLVRFVKKMDKAGDTITTANVLAALGEAPPSATAPVWLHAPATPTQKITRQALAAGLTAAGMHAVKTTWDASPSVDVVDSEATTDDEGPATATPARRKGTRSSKRLKRLQSRQSKSPKITSAALKEALKEAQPQAQAQSKSKEKEKVKSSLAYLPTAHETEGTQALRAYYEEREKAWAAREVSYIENEKLAEERYKAAVERERDAQRREKEANEREKEERERTKKVERKLNEGVSEREGQASRINLLTAKVKKYKELYEEAGKQLDRERHERKSTGSTSAEVAKELAAKTDEVRAQKLALEALRKNYEADPAKRAAELDERERKVKEDEERLKGEERRRSATPVHQWMAPFASYQANREAQRQLEAAFDEIGEMASTNELDDDDLTNELDDDDLDFLAKLPLMPDFSFDSDIFNL